MKKTNKGEISIETAIVMAVILMIIGALIYFSLYVHDVVTIKAYTHAAMVESAADDYGVFKNKVSQQLKKMPLFVLQVSTSYSENIDFYTVEIVETPHTTMKWLNSIIGLLNGKHTMKVTRKISTDRMYLFKAIEDGFKK